jgi:hypothetical protein
MLHRTVCGPTYGTTVQALRYSAPLACDQLLHYLIGGFICPSVDLKSRKAVVGYPRTLSTYSTAKGLTPFQAPKLPKTRWLQCIKPVKEVLGRI